MRDIRGEKNQKRNINTKKGGHASSGECRRAKIKRERKRWENTGQEKGDMTKGEEKKIWKKRSDKKS